MEPPPTYAPVQRLLLLASCLPLTSCITISGELALPGSGQPGALGGSIRGAWSWVPVVREPALPQGKAPVGTDPHWPVLGGKTPIPLAQ